MHLYKLNVHTQSGRDPQQEILAHEELFTVEQFRDMEQQARLDVYGTLDAAERRLFPHYMDIAETIVDVMEEKFGFERAKFAATLNREGDVPVLSIAERMKLREGGKKL